MNNVNINIKDDSIRDSFYIELSNDLEKMYKKSTTFGELTLVGDLILALNNKLRMKEVKENKKDY